MNRTDTIHRLERLVMHLDAKCEGCETCDEIRRLRDRLENNNANNPKVQRILAKGRDMTKSDIEYLISKDVERNYIRKTLKMHNNEFIEMMVGWGFSKKRGDSEMAKLKEFTVEEYQNLKAQGLSDSKIAKRKGVTPPSIAQWKKDNGQVKDGAFGRPKLKAVSGDSTPTETKNPPQEKQQPNNELQELVGTLKRKLEVREMALKQKEEELELLKENTVPLSKYTELKTNYQESETDRIMNFERYQEVNEKYHHEHSLVINFDRELQNTQEQLRKVRDYNARCTKENEHLKALLVMYMGEGKE
ncbi:hypothetical protein FZC79_10355 [Rossellomorea vietnamensis]|uniref:Uncharacterized protein n=1 Tax=Rossellomorea vietnamensis TaxID=218284 RepID=A0A5D4KH29_9BACI|nr:hypothetical protein [Rossellomorea vietnamensis]TYR75563.1 hypothetical protein FZC79_10355 [Rossellomorea vietnamensis]